MCPQNPNPFYSHSQNPHPPMSIPLISSPNLSCKSRLPPISRRSPAPQFHSLRTEELPKSQSRLNSSINFSQPIQTSVGLYPRRNLGFLVNVGTEPNCVDAEDRGESTMPSRFRYLTEEAPDRPLRWPWLVALGFLIYAWRTVLWELSNWTKAVQAIAKFMGYLFKLALAFVFHYIGDPITNLIRFIEISCYTVQDTYASIVASIPFGEFTVIILLTSAVLAIAETLAPESVRSQPYPLAFAGVVGIAAAIDLIPELFFWVLLAGLFCFSFFFKKRDYVQSSLPVAAVLTAIGNPFVRFTAMTSYITLAISRHSQSQLPQEKLDGNESAAKNVGVPFPLVAAAAAIGIHVAAKWIRYR